METGIKFRPDFIGFGGNGGAKPRHADLLVADIDENTAIKYIDRFFMYYIMTADQGKEYGIIDDVIRKRV